jgi:lipopolysaccharide assembly outer membrane protein LptD (OstA)
VKIFYLILTFFVVSPALHASQWNPDSLRSDTAKAATKSDTTKIIQKATADTSATGAEIDSVVTYSATDSVVYSIDNRQMMLYKKGAMNYKDFKLNAGQININWDTSILTARGRKDSTDKIVEQPVFNDGGGTYNSSHITYDFKTQKGRINVANTEIDKNYYHGNLIKKLGKDVLYIENGRFTTCDKDTPDYYFQSSKMKLVVNDKIVAEPIIFYLDGVPVFALPFGVFPSKAGRRSGIITPSFGESANAGRYLSHFGYFWAINDYMDLTTTADWYTRGGYILKSGFRYNLRYYLSGSIYGAYSYRYSGQPGDIPTSTNPGYSLQKNWNLQFNHNQTIDPTTSLVANVNMSSGNYFSQNSYDYNQILQQNLVSDVSLSKNWQQSGNSFSVNIHRDQNLQNGSITATLPSVMFSHSTSYPFRRSEQSSNPSDQLSWYELIGYSYNGQFQNQTSKLWDTTGLGAQKLLDTNATGHFDRASLYGAQHTISISASPKAGFFTISPFVSITDKMYGSRTVVTNDLQSSTGYDSLVYEKQPGFNNIGYFSTGVSASTRLFGIMQPNIWGITAFRHTLQPSLTLTYQPDFSKSYWNYYGRYKDLKGNTQQYSYYQNGIYGGAPSGTVAAASFDLSNNFEMKTLSSDTSHPENKIQLLNLDLSTAYNFAADSMNFSPLNMSYRTNIAQKLDIGGGATFNFYQYDPVSQQRINKYLWSEGKLPEMTSFSLSISTSLQGEKKNTGSRQTQSPDSLAQEQDSLKALKQYNGFYQQVESPNLSIPWNLSFGLVYNLSRNYQNQFQPTASVNSQLSFNLTENWRIGVNGGYDVIQHQIVVPTVTVYRDLHCWEMNLRWNPIGYYRGFNLEIRIKAPQLQDIKITKREDTLVGY